LIRTVITVLIVAALLNAVARAGMTAIDYYELKDEAQQLALFGRTSTEEQLADQVYEKAMELDVPVQRPDIVVNRRGSRTQIDVYYAEEVELFPRYMYPVDLSFTVEAFSAFP
jgi:hypothetical protein